MRGKDVLGEETLHALVPLVIQGHILLLREYEGTRFVRIDEPAIRAFLALPDASDANLRDHIWVIDPLGNLMLRWPRNPDPQGTKADIARLLKAAALWTRVERKD